MLIAWEKLSVFLLFLCGSYEGSSDVYSFREDSLDSYAIVLSIGLHSLGTS